MEATQLPSARGDGVPASSLVDVQDGAKIQHCLAGKADTRVLVTATGGCGFAATLGEMVSNRRAGREFLSLEPGDAPLPPVVYAVSPGNYAALLADSAKLLLKGARLVAAVVSDQPGLAVLGAGAGAGGVLRAWCGRATTGESGGWASPDISPV